MLDTDDAKKEMKGRPENGVHMYNRTEALLCLSGNGLVAAQRAGTGWARREDDHGVGISTRDCVGNSCIIAAELISLSRASVTLRAGAMAFASLVGTSEVQCFTMAAGGDDGQAG